MAAVTIRDLPDEVHRALKKRARSNGKSLESEIRSILAEAVAKHERIKIGTELAALGKLLGSLELEITRDPTPLHAASFE